LFLYLILMNYIRTLIKSKISSSSCNCGINQNTTDEVYINESGLYYTDVIAHKIDSFMSPWVRELQGVIFPEKRYGFKIEKLTFE